MATSVCENCGIRPATVEVRARVDGVERAGRFCHHCASAIASGQAPGPGGSLESMIEGILGPRNGAGPGCSASSRRWRSGCSTRPRARRCAGAGARAGRARAARAAARGAGAPRSASRRRARRGRLRGPARARPAEGARAPGAVGRALGGAEAGAPNRADAGRPPRPRLHRPRAPPARDADRGRELRGAVPEGSARRRAPSRIGAAPGPGAPRRGRRATSHRTSPGSRAISPRSPGRATSIR